MAVDWAGGERELLTSDLPFGDAGGLLSNHESTRHALSLDLKFEHELVSRHGRALPLAVPLTHGVLAGGRHEGEARCATRDRRLDSGRDRVTGRADDRDCRD